ncbi:MAG: hybrid sensor histidine kinase/response regulator [Desulfobacteraceae bacterium]|nr:hybrid sensor histidine kinase/response regulator [Desulfobacteraceae bacterium]MBC2754122.1 hybrid sensor histidine kinase/response regulator [Desulfobacteraceae bacterium]
MNNQDLQQQLLEAFKTEAEERIASMFSNLTELEKSTDAESLGKMLEIVYREAHSLKGAARSVNIIPVETLCQEIEGLFSKLKEEKIIFTPDLFDTLHDAVGVIEKYLSAPEPERHNFEDTIGELTEALSVYKQTENGSKRPGPETQQKNKVPAEQEQIIIPETLSPKKQSSAPAPAQPQAPETLEIFKPVEDVGQSRLSQKSSAKTWFADTVRISTAKLDSLLLKAEELITLKQILNQHLNQIQGTSNFIEKWKKISEKSKNELRKIRLQLHNNSLLDRFFQLYNMNHDQIEETDSKINELAASVEQSNRLLGGMVDDLLDEMKKTSLLPFSTLFSILPRMVREISRDLGKDVDFELSGGDIEIDKRILEGLKDPLIHLIRNAIDHGIEMPDTRKLKQKSPWGKIRLTVSQPESNKVEITVFDDGKGVDVEAIRKKAIKAGLLSDTKATELTDDETISLIFQSGISTSPLITEISGRGLGMAIVQEHIENLSGLIFISTDPGNGTTFKIELPVSLATFRGVIVSASGHNYILPVAHIEHTIRIEPCEIKTVENKSIISLNEHPVSLVALSDLLGLPHQPLPDTKTKKFTMPVVILGSSEKKIACIVDNVTNEQDVLVKSLGKQLKRIPNISGATILGNGQVVPILNVNDLISISSGKSISLTMEKKIDMKKNEPQKTLLIVEDSFTSRTLLKNILEASGYTVTTAIDGEDGYQQLKLGYYDAVISDIEMPKMNGFELTRKIRETETLADKPIILVTSLDSRQDREKGIDVGADAYIVKSSFDQNNLLEVLERLV